MTCTVARQEGGAALVGAALHHAHCPAGTEHSQQPLQLTSSSPILCCHCRLEFDDLHRTGIYTWPYLHELGTHKLSRMRQYVRALKERGLSREPPRLRPGRLPAGGQRQAAAWGQQPGQQPGQQQQAQQPQQPQRSADGTGG